jgi:hypothetical protein
MRAGVQEVAYYQAGPADGDPPQSTAAAAETAQPPFAELKKQPDLASGLVPAAVAGIPEVQPVRCSGGPLGVAAWLTG